MPTNSNYLTPIPDAEAALVFVQGQLIFQRRENGIERAKTVSHSAARAAFAQASLDTGWLPPGTLRWGVAPAGAWAAQVWPAEEATLQFTRTAENDVIPESLTLRLPPLVLVALGADYRLWAVADAEVNEHSLLYYAPFPNIYQEARICFGANQVAPVERDGLHRARRLFWEAPFGASSVAGKSRRNPEDVRLTLQEVAASHEPYPLDDLVPYRQQRHTLGEWLEYLLLRWP